MFPKIVVPPNHPFLIGFSIINHPCWGTSIFWNLQYYMILYNVAWNGSCMLFPPVVCVVMCRYVPVGSIHIFRTLTRNLFEIIKFDEYFFKWVAQWPPSIFFGSLCPCCTEDTSKPLLSRGWTGHQCFGDLIWHQCITLDGSTEPRSRPFMLPMFHVKKCLVFHRGESPEKQTLPRKFIMVWKITHFSWGSFRNTKIF